MCHSSKVLNGLNGAYDKCSIPGERQVLENKEVHAYSHEKENSSMYN